MPRTCSGLKRRRVAAHVAIERRICGDQRALERGQRASEVLFVHRLVPAEGASEQLAVLGDGVQPRDDRGKRAVLGIAPPRISSSALIGSSACASRLRTLRSQNIGAAAGAASAPAREPVEGDVQHRLAVALDQPRRVTRDKRLARRRVPAPLAPMERSRPSE